MPKDESLDRLRGAFERIRHRADQLPRDESASASGSSGSASSTGPEATSKEIGVGPVSSPPELEADATIISPGRQVGVLPKKGWQRRNAQFVSRTILPNMFARRGFLPTVPEFPEIGPREAAVTWIGHASFLVQLAGMNILVDPNWAMWLSVFKRVRHPGLALTDLPDIDLVLITHAHPDHLHLRTLREIANRQPIVVPRGVGSLVQRRGFGEVIEMACWDRIKVGGVELTFTPAAHWGARFVHDTHREFGGYVIRGAEGPSVYHAGDSAMFEGFREIGERCSIDVALLPIGAYNAPSGREVHMNPEEALDVFGTIGANWMVPMHYATFPLGNEPMHEPEERLMWEAEERGILDRLVIMPEGQPHVFAAPIVQP